MNRLCGLLLNLTNDLTAELFLIYLAKFLIRVHVHKLKLTMLDLFAECNRQKKLDVGFTCFWAIMR